MVFFTLRSLNAFLLLEISAPDKFVISVCIFRFTKIDERYSVLPYYYVMAQLCSFVSTSVRCAHGRTDGLVFLTSRFVRHICPGFYVALWITGSPKYDKTGTHVLVDCVEDDLVLSLQVIDAVLFVREFSATLGALKGVLLAALVLQVAVQVVVPVVGSLTVRARVHAFRLAIARLLFGGSLHLSLLPAPLLLVLVRLVGGLASGAFTFWR